MRSGFFGRVMGRFLAILLTENNEVILTESGENIALD